MSSYTTTAIVNGIPVVRRNPAGGPDVRRPDLVEVARNGLETQARDVVRITIEQGNAGVTATAYLAREVAEELATAILRAADLLEDDPQPAPVLAGGIGSPSPNAYTARTVDRNLRVVERAVLEAVAVEAPVSEVLGRVANGLTGDVNGYRERLLVEALRNAADPLLELTQEEAKGLVMARRGDREAQA